MTSALHHLETTIVKIAKKALARGTVTISIHTDPNAFSNKSLALVHASVSAYKTAAQTLTFQYNIANDLSANTLLALPYVFETIEVPLEAVADEQIIQELIKILAVLDAERIAEGAALAKDFFSQIEQLQKHIDQVALDIIDVMETKKQLLITNISPLISTKDPEQKELELLYQVVQQNIDRLDIHEEIVRFKTHLILLQETIQAEHSNEHGKKIDFILQELFREVNTISAKSNDTRISSRAIDIKSIIEKCREQAHNIV
jgi:uncharacterized protein (TIGR00255 family)